MKLKSIIQSIFVLYLLILFSAVRHYNDPVYSGSGKLAENELQSSAALTAHYTLVIPDWSRNTDSKHKDFLEFARTLNEVNHGESEDNSVQRMREDKLEMPAYWFYSDGWRELTLDQKRTLVAGCVYFLNQYLREAICFNEKMKTTYDHFSARITVEEIVNHVESQVVSPCQ